jgi:hypothetical protein
MNFWSQLMSIIEKSRGERKSQGARSGKCFFRDGKADAGKSLVCVCVCVCVFMKIQTTEIEKSHNWRLQVDTEALEIWGHFNRITIIAFLHHHFTLSNL